MMKGEVNGERVKGVKGMKGAKGVKGGGWSGGDGSHFPHRLSKSPQTVTLRDRRFRVLGP